jgi:hypothetical protein
VWFAVAWRLVGDKVGVSATQVRREMELGSYPTAWAMLHRYRSVMIRPGRERLPGEVEVDECLLGDPEPGAAGRGALGKILFAGAVERKPDGRPGRARLAVITDASATSLAAFLADHVEPGARVLTDGWLAYPSATASWSHRRSCRPSRSAAAKFDPLPQSTDPGAQPGSPAAG